MSEFYVFDAKHTCRSCLRTGEDLFTMNNDEISLYRKFVPEKVHTNTIMKICYVCRGMFRKFLKFITQCQRTSEIMNGAVEEDYFSNNSNNYKSVTTTHYVGPETEEAELNCDQYDDNNDEYDDDDVPLLMLKDSIKDDKVKRKDVVTEKNNEVPMENQEKIVKKNNGNQKKQLKAGFSSRMVQETNEYEVIKLSKEQVLEEMAEKAKSEKYLRSVYKCEKCVKGFNFKDVLDNHLKKHSQEHGILKCEICALYCPSAVSLRGHMKSHTTRYKCKKCGAVRIARQHLLEHYSIEHTFDATTYSCDQCPFNTKKRTVIQRHVKSHKLGKNLTCNICGAGFNNMHALRMHISRHDPTQRFSCPQCRMKFIYPSLLHRHMQTHSHKDHYCVECDVKFKSLDNLKLHFKRAKKHRDPSTYKYKCSQCDERFISPSTVLSHLSSAHGAAKKHECTLCGKLFSSRESVRSHERRAHAQRVTCGVCSKGFSHKLYVLAKHLRSHDAPHHCCGFSDSKDKKTEEADNTVQMNQET